MVRIFSGLRNEDVFNPPFAAPSTKVLEPKKAPKGWRDGYRHRPLGHGWPLWAAGLQDFRAQELSGNGAPFSLVRFFWANKRNEHYLIFTVPNSSDNAHFHSDDWQRTIYIDTLGIGATYLLPQKKAFVESGKNVSKILLIGMIMSKVL